MTEEQRKKQFWDNYREKLNLDSPYELVIKFPTQKDKEEFCTWMCEQGEQTWWIWEEIHGDPDNMLQFLYFNENEEWQHDWIKAVRTKDGY